VQLQLTRIRPTGKTGPSGSAATWSTFRPIVLQNSRGADFGSSNKTDGLAKGADPDGVWRSERLIQVIAPLSLAS
jgi:hypothetical protein